MENDLKQVDNDNKDALDALNNFATLLMEGEYTENLILDLMEEEYIDNPILYEWHILYETIRTALTKPPRIDGLEEAITRQTNYRNKSMSSDYGGLTGSMKKDTDLLKILKAAQAYAQMLWKN